MPPTLLRWRFQENLEPPRRVQWMDASRGLIIVIIAIYHASEELMKAGINARGASNTIYPLIGIGMGLFFLLAGMNSRKYIHGTWRLAWRRRLGPLLWLLAIWVPIYWLFYDILLKVDRQPASALLSHLIYSFITPAWGLWFLWSMIIYFTVGKILINAKAKYVIGFFGIISFIGLCTSIWHLRKYGLGWLADNYNWRSTLCFFLFFYLGVRYSASILKFATLSLSRTIVISLSAACLARMLDGAIPTIVIDAPLRLIALVAGLVTAMAIGRILSIVPIIRGIGAATLPIYLIHPLLISSLIAMPALRRMFAQHASPLLPIFLGFACAVISLLIARVLASSKTRWLFSPPAALIRLHDLLTKDSAARPMHAG